MIIVEAFAYPVDRAFRIAVVNFLYFPLLLFSKMLTQPPPTSVYFISNKARISATTDMRLCGMAERVIPNYYFIILSCTLAVIGPLKALGQTWWAAGNGWEYLLGDAQQRSG
jgi:hypothetical protein